MAAPGDDDDSFFPNNERLIDFYLRRKLEGRLSDLGSKVAYFVDADVCSARPEELVRAHGMPAQVQSRDAAEGKQWYFFSPARFVGAKSKKRRSRTIDGTGDKESWHAEGRPKPVECRSGGGGFVTKLSYHVKIGPNAVEKPGWIMSEYSIGDGNLVLCKVYKSPRGPGRSCKRKAEDELAAAAPRSTQPRMTDHEEDAVFAGEIEHNLLSSSVSVDAVVPQIVEQMQSTEESHQPELHFAEASVDELESWMMADVGDDCTTVQVPAGEDPDAYYMRVVLGDNEDAAILTVHGLLTDDDVIAALATGATVDELLPSAGEVPAAPAMPAPAIRMIDEHNLQSVEEVPDFGETHKMEQYYQPEPQIVPASCDGHITPVDVQDWMVADVEDGQDFEAYYKRFWGDEQDRNFESQCHVLPVSN